ncbi:MAG: hypothetical protein ACXVBX_11185 [Flavisolibacter sp.]
MSCFLCSKKIWRDSDNTDPGHLLPVSITPPLTITYSLAVLTILMNHPHPFHIPVLGLCYTIDTPLMVARYGISSVLSIVEDELIEDMRAYHALRNGIAFTPITKKDPDYRARRITAYLNLLHDLIERQVSELKTSSFDTCDDLHKYFELLPDNAREKTVYRKMLTMDAGETKELLRKHLIQSIVAGDIDVNIMAKLDNPAYTDDGEKMPEEFSDAVAALRGFANSKLSSSIVFSAGYNPKLFNYAELHEDFYPESNHLRKKIILKVSDYRSALVQGKLLAKKGLWVSEFRIESGVNCGGHAFPTEGILMGPILEEFKTNREALAEELLLLCNTALAAKGREKFSNRPAQKISGQGGVGTHEEQHMLLQYFQLDSVGWGSPFLLVPEVTNVDEVTLEQLANAQPEDYFLSNASPLGVPFHNFRKSSSEAQRKERIVGERPGSPCYKKYLTSDTEFTEIPICTASRQYQQLKEKQLGTSGISPTNIQIQIETAREKDCLCEGLTSSVRLKNQMKLSHKLSAVTICPGPNLKWFSGVFSLKEMVDHIYGRMSINNSLYRPNMFINELKLYVDYFKKQLMGSATALNEKQARHFQKFKSNLLNGIAYYKTVLVTITNAAKTLEELCQFEKELMAISL